MRLEITWSDTEYASGRCYMCKFLVLKRENNLWGRCVCEVNKIKNRTRCISDKKCTHKVMKEWRE